jgi:hypothetical protein
LRTPIVRSARPDAKVDYERMQGKVMDELKRQASAR